MNISDVIKSSDYRAYIACTINDSYLFDEDTSDFSDIADVDYSFNSKQWFVVDDSCREVEIDFNVICSFSNDLYEDCKNLKSSCVNIDIEINSHNSQVDNESDLLNLLYNYMEDVDFILMSH